MREATVAKKKTRNVKKSASARIAAKKRAFKSLAMHVT